MIFEQLRIDFREKFSREGSFSAKERTTRGVVKVRARRAEFLCVRVTERGSHGTRNAIVRDSTAFHFRKYLRFLNPGARPEPLTGSWKLEARARVSYALSFTVDHRRPLKNARARFAIPTKFRIFFVAREYRRKIGENPRCNSNVRTRMFLRENLHYCNSRSLSNDRCPRHTA